MDLLCRQSYGDVIEDLTNLWGKADTGTKKPSCTDGKWVNSLSTRLEEMKTLDLVREEPDKPKRGRGRPWKKPADAKA